MKTLYSRAIGGRNVLQAKTGERERERWYLS